MGIEKFRRKVVMPAISSTGQESIGSINVSSAITGLNVSFTGTGSYAGLNVASDLTGLNCSFTGVGSFAGLNVASNLTGYNVNIENTFSGNSAWNGVFTIDSGDTFVAVTTKSNDFAVNPVRLTMGMTDTASHQDMMLTPGSAGTTTFLAVANKATVVPQQGTYMLIINN